MALWLRRASRTFGSQRRSAHRAWLPGSRGLVAAKDRTWTLDMPKWGLPLADGVVGEVGEVLCGVGDAVRRDEVVVVVETDKVSVDIRAARDGVVAAVLSARGEEVSEGPGAAALPNPKPNPHPKQVSEGQALLRFCSPSETVEAGQQRPRDWAEAHRRRRLAQAEEATPILAQP